MPIVILYFIIKLKLEREVIIVKKTEMMTELSNETGLTKAEVQKVFEATFELFKKEL